MNATIQLLPVEQLVHIEGYSDKRVSWLEAKIRAQGVWTKPLAIDAAHSLVLDGQHRMEVAIRMGLVRVPVVKYDYSKVRLWSLRPNHQFDWLRVTDRALAAAPYPYKTVKHALPFPVPSCAIALKDLLR